MAAPQVVSVSPEDNETDIILGTQLGLSILAKTTRLARTWQIQVMSNGSLMNGFFSGGDFPNRPTGLASPESPERAEVGVGWIVSSGVGLLRGGLSTLLLVGWF